MKAVYNAPPIERKTKGAPEKYCTIAFDMI